MTCHKSIHATALNESETNKPLVVGKSRNFQTLCRLLIPGGAEQSFIRWSSATRSSPFNTLGFDKKGSPSCTDKTTVNILDINKLQNRTLSRLFQSHKIPLVRAFCAFSQTQMNDFPFPHSFVPGGTPYMKGVGMLVLSLMGVNFGFWSRLGCSGQNTIIFSRKGFF